MDSVIPQIERLPGYCGGYFLVERERGTVLRISFWDSLEHLHDADVMSKNAVTGMMVVTSGSSISVDVCDVLVSDPPPSVRPTARGKELPVSAVVTSPDPRPDRRRPRGAGGGARPGPVRRAGPADSRGGSRPRARAHADRTAAPDVVLLDHRLPDGDGIAALAGAARAASLGALRHPHGEHRRQRPGRGPRGRCSGVRVEVPGPRRGDRRRSLRGERRVGHLPGDVGPAAAPAPPRWPVPTDDLHRT